MVVGRDRVSALLTRGSTSTKVLASFRNLIVNASSHGMSFKGKKKTVGKDVVHLIHRYKNFLVSASLQKWFST